MYTKRKNWNWSWSLVELKVITREKGKRLFVWSQWDWKLLKFCYAKIHGYYGVETKTICFQIASFACQISMTEFWFQKRCDVSMRGAGRCSSSEWGKRKTRARFLLFHWGINSAFWNFGGCRKKKLRCRKKDWNLIHIFNSSIHMLKKSILFRLGYYI